MSDNLDMARLRDKYIKMNQAEQEDFDPDRERVIGKIVYSRESPYVDLRIGEFINKFKFHEYPTHY
jgi:hypothetical protein